MQWVPDFVENKFELAALVVFLSIGVLVTLGTLELDRAAGLVSVFGFAVLLPLVLIFGDRLIESAEEPATENPLETLRDRYARGEITHEEFERRVDRLLETDDLDRSDAESAREMERARE